MTRHLRRSALPLVLALGAALPSGALAAGSWSAPAALSPAGSSAVPAGAFLPSDGRSLVVYGDGGSRFLATGTAGGSFAPPAQIGAAQADSSAPAAAIGSDGALAVAWTTADTVHVSVVRPGGSPSESQIAAPKVAGASVAVGSDGAVTVAFRTRPTPSTYALLAVLAAPGGSFGAPQTLASGGAAIDAPDVAAGPNGAVAVAYRRQAPQYRAHVAVKPPGAGAFEPGEKLGAGTAADLSPRVAYESDGALVAAWSNPGGAAYAVRPAGASVFGAAGGLGPAGEPGYALDLVPTPQGGAAATWTTGSVVKAATLPPGGVFGAPADVVRAASAVVSDPRIAVSPSGAATVVVIDPASGEVRAADLGGAVATIGYALRDAASGAPVVASSGDRTVAVWRDATGTLVAATRSAQSKPATSIGTPPAATDHRRPKLSILTSLRKPLRVSRRTTRLSIAVRCDEACALAGTGALRIERPGKRRTIAPLQPFHGAKARTGRQAVVLKLGPSTLRDLRRSLARGRGAQAYLDLTATDVAGNATRRTLRLSLRPASKRR